MTTDILDLSRARVHARCPSCASVTVVRSGQPQNMGPSMNGDTLWTLTEACIMCGWGTSLLNVRIGA